MTTVDDKYWRGSAFSKRKFYQIHLFTAIVLMFVSGILLWANLTSYEADTFWNGQKIGTVPGCGWPFNTRPTVFGNSTLWDPNPFKILVNFVRFGQFQNTSPNHFASGLVYARMGQPFDNQFLRRVQPNQNITQKTTYQNDRYKYLNMPSKRACKFLISSKS